MTELKRIREERGYTQQQVADGAGVSQTMIALYESGSRTPRLDTAIKLANFLNVRVDELLGQPKAGQMRLC